jgi:regulatory protein
VIPPAESVVTALQPQRRDPQRVNVHVNGAFCCGAAYEAVHAERLRVGEPVTAEALARIRAADERWRAKQSALSLLAARPRARRELADRLRAKQFGSAAVEWAVGEAERLGLLDDAAFAESWVRDRLRLKPRGSRALVAELTRKGVASDVAHRAVERTLHEQGVGDAALCTHAATKWLLRHGPLGDAGDAQHNRRILRRLSAFLQRRGYGAEHVRSALNATVGHGKLR